MEKNNQENIIKSNQLEKLNEYAELIYNGYWFSKERFKLQKIVDLKRNKVNGSVKARKTTQPKRPMSPKRVPRIMTPAPMATAVTKLVR